MGTTLVGSRTTHGRPLHPLELKIVKKASGPATRNRERVGTPRCASLDSPSFAFSLLLIHPSPKWKVLPAFPACCAQSTNGNGPQGCFAYMQYSTVIDASSLVVTATMHSHVLPFHSRSSQHPCGEGRRVFYLPRARLRSQRACALIANARTNSCSDTCVVILSLLPKSSEEARRELSHPG
jgi:hypothetical protein